MEVGGATFRNEVVGKALTTSEQLAELAAKEPVGVYVATILCVPTVEKVFVKKVLPLMRLNVPTRLSSSVNATEPVGVPLADVTVTSKSAGY